MVGVVPSPTSFATPAKSPLIGNGWGRIAAPASSFFQGGPTKTTPLYGVTGGSLILNGTGGYLGSGIWRRGSRKSLSENIMRDCIVFAA